MARKESGTSAATATTALHGLAASVWAVMADVWQVVLWYALYTFPLPFLKPALAVTARDLMPLQGRVALVTGGNRGIGAEVALGLLRRGARVYLAARSPARAQAAMEEMRAVVAGELERGVEGTLPGGEVRFLLLDLEDLASVARAARELRQRERALHVLVNNAGHFATPFRLTRDGVEAQVGLLCPAP
jgi:hypothetical protein